MRASLTISCLRPKNSQHNVTSPTDDVTNIQVPLSFSRAHLRHRPLSGSGFLHNAGLAGVASVVSPNLQANTGKHGQTQIKAGCWMKPASSQSLLLYDLIDKLVTSEAAVFCNVKHCPACDTIPSLVLSVLLSNGYG